MFTVIVFFLVLSLLVIIHELGHFTAAKLNGVKVEEFGFGIPPRIFGIKFGETLYSLNLLPFGGFVKVFGEEEAQIKKGASKKALERSFAHKAHWQKAVILTAGVFLNFVLGWVIVTYLFTQGVHVPTDKVTIVEVVEGSPAAEAGIVTDDEIVSVITDSEKILIDDTVDIAEAAQKYAGETITLEILRGEETINIAVVPRENPPEGEGSLGIAISNLELRTYTLTEAPYHALIESAKMTGLIAKELGKTLVLFVTFQKPEADIAGPVGIAKITSDAARQGLNPLLQLIGILSLNLAVINILPFPALDGGRLMFVIYEWITGRKVNPSFEQKLNFVGFAFLISLLILVTINDIVNLL